MPIRPATPADEPFILSQASRFGDCDLPPWLTPQIVAEGTAAWLRKSFAERPGHACFLIAESEGGQPLGFLYAFEREDFFTGKPYAHVSELAVATEAEGMGVGRALMESAEAWARSQGYRRVQLNVFAANHSAHRFYERLGYEQDARSYSKRI